MGQVTQGHVLRHRARGIDPGRTHPAQAQIPEQDLVPQQTIVEVWTVARGPRHPCRSSRRGLALGILREVRMSFIGPLPEEERRGELGAFGLARPFTLPPAEVLPSGLHQVHLLDEPSADIRDPHPASRIVCDSVGVP